MLVRCSLKSTCAAKMDPTPTVGKLPEVRVDLLKRRKALASGRAKEIQNRIDNRKRDKVLAIILLYRALSTIAATSKCSFQASRVLRGTASATGEGFEAGQASGERIADEEEDRSREKDRDKGLRSSCFRCARSWHQSGAFGRYLTNFSEFFLHRFIHECVKRSRHSASMARTWEYSCE